MRSLLNIKYSIIGLLLILFMGVAGYRIIEGWPVMDALYMTVTTISTVGFTEVGPLSEAGRLFTMLLIVSGIGLFAYAAGAFAAFVMEGQFINLLGRQKILCPFPQKA